MLRAMLKVCVLALLIAASAVSACGEGNAEAVSAAAFGQPGTPLGDGFDVVDGTLLIGDPIPLGREVPLPAGANVSAPEESSPVDQGWVASLKIDDGDPVEIMDAYIEQAEAAGMIEQPGTGCSLDYEPELRCSAFARSPDRDPPVSLGVQFVRGQRNELVSDHVIVRYSTADLYCEFGQDSVSDDLDVEILPAPSLPPLTQAGEQLPDGGEPLRVLTVEEGSRPAGSPHLNVNDATGGITAMLEVTDEPARVLTRYREQLAGVNITGRDPITQVLNGATVTTLYADQPGGDYFELVLVERSDRPTWLSVKAGHD